MLSLSKKGSWNLCLSRVNWQMLAVGLAKDARGKKSHESFGVLLNDFDALFFDDFLPVEKFCFRA